MESGESSGDEHMPDKKASMRIGIRKFEMEQRRTQAPSPTLFTVFLDIESYRAPITSLRATPTVELEALTSVRVRLSSIVVRLSSRRSVYLLTV